MVKFYDQIWEQGEHIELPPAHHYQPQYQKRIKSMVVPAGFKVTFYTHSDRSGDQLYPFYEGTYHDVSWYGVKEYPGMIHVEKTEVTANDLVEIGYYGNYEDGGKKHSFYMHHKLPIGEYFAPDHFWNDLISHLQIPFGVCCEVFRDKDKGNSLIFDGVNEGGRTHIGLPDYDYAWTVSRIKISADDWINAGTAIENAEVEDDEVEASVFELANNRKAIESGDVQVNQDGTITKSITTELESSVETNWEITASVSAKAGFEAGTETVKATGEIEVQVGGGYGESKSVTKSREVTDEVSANVPPGDMVHGSIMIARGVLNGDIVRKWRNKRTGYIVETRGKIRVENAEQTRAEIH